MHFLWKLKLRLLNNIQTYLLLESCYTPWVRLDHSGAWWVPPIQSLSTLPPTSYSPPLWHPSPPMPLLLVVLFELSDTSPCFPNCKPRGNHALLKEAWLICSRNCQCHSGVDCYCSDCKMSIPRLSKWIPLIYIVYYLNLMTNLIVCGVGHRCPATSPFLN